MLTGLTVLAAAIAVGEPSSDPIQGLIASEKAAYQEWLNAGDEPPTAYLAGDRNAVQLYSPAHRNEDDLLLCHEPNLPELIELTGGDPASVETVLNLSLRRIRDQLGEACLIRPGDRAVAIGPGWQLERSVAAFIVRREQPACPADSPYSLWITFNEELPGDPFFVTTDPAAEEIDNVFVPADQYPVASAGPELMARLKDAVKFPEDYRVTLIDIRAPELEGLAFFERSTVSERDNGLPAMIAVTISGPQARPIWTERVDVRHGTGRFAFVGTVDIDGDGVREIILQGVHQSCAYRVVFQRSERGFEPLPIPIRSCRC